MCYEDVTSQNGSQKLHSLYLVQASGGTGIRENFVVERRHDTKHGGIRTQVDVKLIEHEK